MSIENTPKNSVSQICRQIVFAEKMPEKIWIFEYYGEISAVKLR